MKSKIRLTIAAIAVLTAAALMSATPRSKSLTTLRDADQFAKIESGDSVFFVCNECKTVTEQTIGSVDQAMMFCKEGSKVTCPMCKEVHKVILRGRPAARTTRHEVVYVNAKGEECFFIANAMDS